MILAKLDAPTADAAAQAITREMTRMALSLLKTMSEVARYAEIAAYTCMKIYFADPHCRGSAAAMQIIGLLRQYLPKGTDLPLATQ